MRIRHEKTYCYYYTGGTIVKTDSDVLLTIDNESVTTDHDSRYAINASATLTDSASLFVIQEDEKAMN